MSDKDNIYTDNESMIVDFSFDEKVVKVFPDMIRRSVPGYESIITMIGLLAEEYAQQDSNIYDLGCSLGAATLAMIRNVKESGCNIIAVDNAKAMIEKCQSNPDFKNNHIETTWRYSDIQDIDIDNASVVVMNFTLHFSMVLLRWCWLLLVWFVIRLFWRSVAVCGGCLCGSSLWRLFV